MIFSSRAGTKLNKDAVIKMNKKGFSLSELLVVTLIISVVAAASTPFINPKKQKKEVTKAPHGIFECYYKDGQLYQYTADNKSTTFGTPKRITDKDYCEFVAPEANYFRFQLIGAGGNGYKGQVNTTTVYESINGGSIPLTSLSQVNSNLSIPNWVKTKLRNASIPIDIIVISPMGNSGSTQCIREFSNTKCRNHACLEGDTSDCPSNCFENNSFIGGSSGAGHSYSGKIYVNSYSNISYGASSTNAYFKHNSSQVNLTRSGNGENGTSENKNPRNGSASGRQNSIGGLTYTSISPITAPTCITYGKTVSANLGSPGRSYPNPTSISYSQSVPRLSLELGENGKPGKIENYTFPYLGGKKFKIKPAKNSSQETIVSFGTTRVISAQPGEDAPTEKPDGIRDTRQVVSSIGRHPVDYKPQNVNDDSRLLKLVSNNDTNLKSMIDKEEIYPGNGGYGSYPYLTTFSGLRKYLELAGTTYSDGTMTIKPTVATGKCINGSTKKGGSNVYKQYCEGTDGNSGAVRIVW